MKKEVNIKCNSLNQTIAALNVQLIEKEELIAVEKMETIEWIGKYKVLVQNVDKLVEHHTTLIESMNKEIQNQAEQIHILNQISTQMANYNSNGLSDIAKMKLIISPTKEQIEPKTFDDAQYSATISSLHEEMTSVNTKLAQKDNRHVTAETPTKFVEPIICVSKSPKTPFRRFKSDCSKVMRLTKQTLWTNPIAKLKKSPP